MDDGGGDSGCSFEVKHGSDAAETPGGDHVGPMCINQERERLEMWLEKER